MSFFQCPDCEDRVGLFGDGGGDRLASHLNIPLLGSLPIAQAIREGGDNGRPIVLDDPQTADAFSGIAEQVEATIDDLADVKKTAGFEVNIYGAPVATGSAVEMSPAAEAAEANKPAINTVVGGSVYIKSHPGCYGLKKRSAR